MKETKLPAALYLAASLLALTAAAVELTYERTVTTRGIVLTLLGLSLAVAAVVKWRRIGARPPTP